MSVWNYVVEGSCPGGLGIEERTVSQHGAGHVQETVGHTAQSAWMGMTAFAQLGMSGRLWSSGLRSD